MNLPPKLPQPLEHEWVIRVRRGLATWHVHPDCLDRHLADVQRATDGRLHMPTEYGVLHLDESDVIEIRNHAMRSPR